MQHGQGGIGQAGFDAAHVGPKHPTPVGQLFLRQFLLGAQFLDAQSQGLLDGGCFEGHPVSLVLVYLFVHTPIHT